jgi:aspartyl-tRNA(Asn)/glutamyl-tRNA(Gln) amidotransferase subunit C
MAQVSEVISGSQGAERPDEDTPLREDVPVPSLDRALVMAAAPDTDGVFFKVPRVIER